MCEKKFLIIGEGRLNTMDYTVYKCLIKLNVNVSIFKIDKGHLFSKNWIINRFFLEINKLIDSLKTEKKLIKTISKIRPDFIIIFKGNKVNIHSLKKEFKTLRYINWHVDDPLNKNYIDQIGIDSLLNYDMHISSRKHLFEKYKNLGFKNLRYIDFAADSEIFNKHNHNKYFISFVGNYSLYREKIIRRISESFKIDIWGSGWYKNYKNKNKNISLNGFSHHNKYVKISMNSSYCINILTPENSDKSNLRIFEQLALETKQLVLGKVDKKIKQTYGIKDFETTDELIDYIRVDVNKYKLKSRIFYEDRVEKLLEYIDEIWSNSPL